MPSPKNLYSFDRPREKLIANGVENLDSVELIALILGSGSKGKNVAELSWEIYRKIDNQVNFSATELTQIKGLSLAKAARLVASVELARRLNQKLKQPIVNALDVWPWVQDIAGLDKEHLVCLSLNGAAELIRKRIVSVGTLSATLIHPREIYADVIQDHAASIILVHNHPSNNIQPSTEDLEVTDLITQAGIILGIPMLDHLIVNREGEIYSLLNKQQIE